jgi:site-specific DNA-methyltransferase (adenine-specific)
MVKKKSSEEVTKLSAKKKQTISKKKFDIKEMAIKPYYKSDRFILYHSDTLEVLPQVPEDSIDMIFADPPYNLSNGGFTCHAGKRVSVNKGDWDKSEGIENDFEFHKAWIGGCRKVLTRNGTIWISGTYHSIYASGLALQLAGYHILNDICWFKPNAPPNLSTRFFTASHETVIWARKQKNAKHTFNYKQMKEGAWPEDRLKNPGKQMRSVWAIKSPDPIEKKFGKHPTQKPEKLLKRIILASTNKGDMVLDPFTGSSTTGLIAYLYGRSFIGVDSEKKYLDLSIKRFEELTKNLKRKGRQGALADYSME